MMHLNSLICLNSSVKENAQTLAERLELNCVDGSSVSTSAKARQAFIANQCAVTRDTFALVLSADGLFLHAIDLQGNNFSVRADFHGATVTYRRKKGGGTEQMIAP